MTEQRHPLNAPGDFYVIAGDCLICLLAEESAPDLMGFDEADPHCYFRKQPTTPEETNRAIRALQVSCCEAHRYAGKDAQILEELISRGCGSQCDGISSGG